MQSAGRASPGAVAQPSRSLQSWSRSRIGSSVRIAECEAQQVLNQIALFVCGQIEIQAGAVVVDDSAKCREAAVVIETAFDMRQQRADRSWAIPEIGSAVD